MYCPREVCWHFTNIALSALVLGFLFRTVDAANKDCYKKDASTAVEASTMDKYANDFDVNNIFECETDKDCCVENDETACCGTGTNTDSIYENIALWGGLIATFCIIGAVIYYFRSDIFICDSTGKQGKTVRDCCCCCCPSNERHEVNEIQDIDDLPADSEFNSQQSLSDPSSDREMAYRQTIQEQTV